MDFGKLDHILLEAVDFADLHALGFAPLLLHHDTFLGVVQLICSGSGFIDFYLRLGVLRVDFYSFELEVGLHPEGEGFSLFLGWAVGDVVLFAELLDLLIDFHGDLFELV